MWTFCLIKGLDTLPWSRRKAPFISSYWIFVCVVSLLFNFTPQFAFITAQPREPVDIQKQCHAEFKYLQPGHWLESICVHYHLNVLDSSSITEGMAAVQTWLIWEVNISRLFFFFFLMCIGCRVRKHVVACQSWWCILRSSVFFFNSSLWELQGCSVGSLVLRGKINSWCLANMNIYQCFQPKIPKSDVCLCSRYKDWSGWKESWVLFVGRKGGRSVTDGVGQQNILL